MTQVVTWSTAILAALFTGSGAWAVTLSAEYELQGGAAAGTIPSSPLVHGFDAKFIGSGNNLLRINITNSLDRLEIDTGPAIGGSDESGPDLTGPWDFDVEGDALLISFTNLTIGSISSAEPWTGPGNPQPLRTTPSPEFLNGVATLESPSLIKIDWPVGSAPSDSRISYDLGDVQVVPIPAAVWLFGSALGFLGLRSRRTTGRSAASKLPEKPTPRHPRKPFVAGGLS